MSQLKEQNGKYYQEVEVVMLATREESYINKDGDKLSYIIEPIFRKHLFNGQHLYFLSDEVLPYDSSIFKTGVFYHKDPTGEVYIITKDSSFFPNPNFCRRIIATTDESLTYTSPVNPFIENVRLPKPSDSFIKKYIEEYNAGKTITDVLVEYEKTQEPINYHKDIFHNVERLKVDSDNTITIVKLKDSYSREEVKRMLEDSMYFGANWGGKLTSKISNNWIKENL